jgi:hypothetical protein
MQLDGSFASLAAWMTEPVASRFEIGGEPHFSLHILRSMRAEVDALLGFLLSNQTHAARQIPVTWMTHLDDPVPKFRRPLYPPVRQR